ncbi:MAG TPA: MarR family transcriptional regulator [Casimicrobiaceae bacterium]|nr:MarR family transcriptional regulator [Casimicrobiaceae bacterium]
MPNVSSRTAATKRSPSRINGNGSRRGGGRAKADSGAAERVPTFLKVLRQFRELFRVSQQHFQRVETKCGVSGAQLWALCEIGERPGMTVSELSRALSIHLSTASNLLDKLEARKLIRRDRGAADQRVVHVFITREGEKVVKRAPSPAEGVIPDALQKMPERALLRLNSDLTRVLELASIRRPSEGLKHLAEP